MRTIVVILISGCISSNSVVCEDGTVCPESSVCDPVHHLCVSPDQLAACDGKADLDACDRGNCQQGVCLPIACGNGRVDVGEACDDGNTLALDGCAADCRSNETCGNGRVDLPTGEHCDDGNVLEHDGCSSRCEVERAAWVAFASSARMSGVAAYDAHANAVVAFGGFVIAGGVAQELGPLVTWNGQWTPIVALGPEPRDDAAMAFDASHGHTVLFGGASTKAFHDTWAWDGVAWTKLQDGPQIGKACMVYDARRKKLVLFGGQNVQTGALLADTWQFDDTGWTKRTLIGPSARMHPACTYDPERGVMILFGGHTAAGASNELWQFDGATWLPITTTGAPPGALEHAALGFDRVGHRAVLFGGADATGASQAKTFVLAGTTWTALAAQPIEKREGALLVDDGRGLILFGGEDTAALVTPNDLWRWDGIAQAWTQYGPLPPSRTASTIAADPDHRRVLVFGGKGVGGVALGDTWELSDLGWRQYATTTTTFGSAITYDAARGQTVRFGGRTTGPTNTTFAWSGATWSPLSPSTSPPARFAHAFAYDPATRTSILFGGTTSAGFLGDTWQWDGINWSPLSPSMSPSPRTGSALAYDYAHGQLVLYGGLDAATSYTDTWTWDGTTWTKAAPTDDDPAGLISPALVWNAARQRLVLVGGYDSRRDQWEWDGTRWTFLLTTESPPGVLAPLAYPLLDGSGYAVLGGTTQSVLRDDSMLFTYTSDHGADTCTAGVELDGDGRAGCADPDCWTVCTPDCPPGASCDASTPRCGDGICSAIESCHTCPSDCSSCPTACGDFVCDPGEVCPGDCG